jgi:hypothetical protein
MCRKHLALIFAVLLMIPLIGCGIKNVLPSKEVPPLEGYSTVVLVPFDVKNPSGQHEKLPTMLSYSIGTKLEVRHQDNNWLFDKSQEITPVSNKMKELNITPADVYQDPQAAAKLAEAFQADLVITGQMEEPRFTKEASGKIEYDMSESTVTGAARYYSVHQTAILKVDARVTDAGASQMIWDGRIIGYKKYKTRYRTGNPELSQSEESMLADVRKDFVSKFAEKLYPAKAAEGK